SALTIGIGAGPGCDGQVLVMHDVLGLDPTWKPRFARRYAALGDAAVEASGARPAATDVAVVSTPAEMSAWAEATRRAGARIAFVPTMGYLHAGHVAL